MEFPRQEYLSGQPFPSLQYLPDPGTKPGSIALQADILPSEPPKKPKHPQDILKLKGRVGCELQEENVKMPNKHKLKLSTMAFCFAPRAAMCCA